jgi:hypothetical protein
MRETENVPETVSGQARPRSVGFLSIGKIGPVSTGFPALMGPKPRFFENVAGNEGCVDGQGEAARIGVPNAVHFYLARPGQIGGHMGEPEASCPRVVSSIACGSLHPHGMGTSHTWQICDLHFRIAYWTSPVRGAAVNDAFGCVRMRAA